MNTSNQTFTSQRRFQLLALCASIGALLFTACGGEDDPVSSAGAESPAGAEAPAGAESPEGGAESPEGGATSAGPWGETCLESAQCSAPTDFCVKQPGMDEGYCTYACTNNAECTSLEAPSDWSCNTLNFAGCEDVPSNWCGPVSEITMFSDVIIECP